MPVLLVSTHGCRCLTQSTTSADALPEVAVGRRRPCRAEVYVDSGLRTPEHVAAALCLGARPVFLGRPVPVGAGHTGGAERVEQLLQRVRRAARAGGPLPGRRNSLDELGADLLV